jgi:hypothetical protein
MTTNRETVRDALVTLVSDNLTGSGNPLQSVTGHGLDTLDEVSHMVIKSAGSGRPPFRFGKTGLVVYLLAEVWVLATDGGDWGRDDAEDRLDLIEKEFASLLESNHYTANWQAIDYEDRSRVGEVMTVTGLPYLVEMIPLEVQVLDG